jgi:hypothetical protein
MTVDYPSLRHACPRCTNEHTYKYAPICPVAHLRVFTDYYQPRRAA